MAIRDALWACPFCREIGSIRPTRDAEVCSACGAEFQPAAAATITARAPGSVPETRSLQAWESDLPDLDQAAERIPPPGKAVLRTATAPRPVHFHEGLLGWAERFGPKTEATVELREDDLVIRTGAGSPEIWDLAAVTAVQPSSSSVQLRRRDGMLIALAFPDGSVRLWEARFQAAVRRAYRNRGRGEITEFHPTIRTA
ncbi:MAG: hypothetical protein PVH00_04445 [Gemmatimonadota bacterium]|jgi:hypothetical protein